MSFSVACKVYETDPRKHSSALQDAASAAIQASRHALPEPNDPAQWNKEDEQLHKAFEAAMKASGELPEGGRVFLLEGDSEKFTHDVKHLSKEQIEAEGARALVPPAKRSPVTGADLTKPQRQTR